MSAPSPRPASTRPPLPHAPALLAALALGLAWWIWPGEPGPGDPARLLTEAHPAAGPTAVAGPASGPASAPG